MAFHCWVFRSNMDVIPTTYLGCLKMIYTCTLYPIQWELAKNEGRGVKLKTILHQKQILIVIYSCSEQLIRVNLKIRFIHRFASMYSSFPLLYSSTQQWCCNLVKRNRLYKSRSGL